MTLPYRALFIDPDNPGDRPKQIFGTSRVEVEDWAKLMLAKSISQDAKVELYQTTEALVETIRQPKAEAK